MKLHFHILMIIGEFKEDDMGKSIVDIRNMGDALRNTGYKNIESAVSEIIDNSVEAGAKNIFCGKGLLFPEEKWLQRLVFWTMERA